MQLSRSFSHIRPVTLYLAVILLLAFWLTRTIVITHFPAFIDEIFHINFGADAMTRGPLMHADEGRQLTVWWFILFGAPVNAPIAAARFATALVVTIGVAALMAVGRAFAGIWGMLIVGILYTASTYHTFFERMALADPISAACVALAVYFACHLVRRASLTDAILTGFTLFLAVGAKISALPYLSLPLIAVLTLRPPDTTRRQRLKWLIVALAVEGVLIVAFLGIIIWRGYDPFFYLAPGKVIEGSNIAIDRILGRIPSNVMVILSVISSYLSWLGLLLGAASLGYWLFRRQLFLFLLFFLPLAVLWTSERQATRHLMVPVTLLILSIGIMLADLVRGRSTVIKTIVVAGIGVWLLPLWLPFMSAYLNNPAALPLSSADQHEYMSSESSSFGVDKVGDYLKQQPVTQVIGLFSTCTSLKWMTGQDFAVNCPSINPNGEDIDALNQLMHDNRKAGVFVVLEQLTYLPASAPGKLVQVIQRPGNGLPLSIYDLSP